MTKKTYKLGVALTCSITLFIGCAQSNSVKEPELSPPTIGEEELTAIDDYLTDLGQQGMSGVILIAKEGDILFSKGYGMANREESEPMTADTVMDIASITKQFTTAAIMKLEAEGKVAVEDPITKYFDPVPEDKKGITLHQLLTHTSGLAGGIGDDYKDLPDRTEYIRRALEAELVEEPGDKFSYSNVGFSLLGAIIELIAEQPYEEYLYENFLAPAGMHHTGYTLPDWTEHVLAVGYVDKKAWGTPIDHAWLPDGPGWNLRTNGGILTTAKDMLLWSEALKHNQVLAEEVKRKMWNEYVRVEGERLPYRHYGYGWGVDTSARGTLRVTHTGGAAAFDAHLQIWVDEGIMSIMMTSNDDFRSRNFTGRINEIIFRDEF